MEIIINDKNIADKNIESKIEKVRALIINENNKILIANYAGIPLLPGGKVDANERLEKAIIRELAEELGVNYNKEELQYYLTIKFYQENYPCRDGNICNRKLTTHYYFAPYKEPKEDLQSLTNHEKENNFHLELLSFEELQNKLNKLNKENPRSIHFKRELNIILENYINNKNESR